MIPRADLKFCPYIYHLAPGLPCLLPLLTKTQRALTFLAVAGLPLLQRVFFFIAINPLAGKQKVPVNLVPIEFRAINADKLGCIGH